MYGGKILTQRVNKNTKINIKINLYLCVSICIFEYQNK